MRCTAWLFVLLIGIDWSDVIAFGSDLVRRNGVDEEFERAAFLVRDGHHVTMTEWPFRRDYKLAHWRGSIPTGAFAIIHTHPSNVPRPSLHDKAEAKRTGMPVFVATRARVCVVTPDGEIECVSAKPRPQVRRIAAAADEWLGPVSKINPE